MKKLLALVTAVSFMGCATIRPELLRFQAVHETEGAKDVLYARALAWLAHHYVDSKAVIEVQDKENGKIIGKGVTVVPQGLGSARFLYTITIEVKDGRSRLTMENPLMDVGPPRGLVAPMIEGAVVKLQTSWRGDSTSLATALRTADAPF